MSCDANCKEPCACPALQQAVRATSARADAQVVLHKRHNRWAVHVTPAATVVGGDVAVSLGIDDPDAASQVLWANAGSVAFAVGGGRATGVMAGVGHKLRVAVTGYAGAGELVVLVESWREGDR